MKLEELMEQLESLLSESRYMASQKDSDDIFKADQVALEETLDILHDYELQAEQIRKDSEHFHTETKPAFRNGVWLCPKCGRKVQYNHTHCNIETINDLDGNVVNLFEWIRKDPERLAREIYYTPYARQVYEDAFSAVPEGGLEKAVNFYIRLNMGHGFRTNGEKVGWKNDVQGRERAYAAQDWVNLPDKIFQAAERLRGVQIENKPVVDVIRRFNHGSVLIYCDPPYMLETRHGKQYRHEMDDEGHKELLEALLCHKGPALISGYDTELYRDMLSGWHRYERVSYSQVCSKKQEVLWANFAPQCKQMTLEL